MSDRITQATATAGYGVSESASKVLRNTYMLLSMTLFFSAGMTALAVSTQAPHALVIVIRRDDWIVVCSPSNAKQHLGLAFSVRIYWVHGLEPWTDDLLLPAISRRSINRR